VSLWCYLLPNPHETWKVYDDNHVHPNFRTPDLTSFALDWWMARAKERVAASGVVLPIEYHQNVYPAQVDHISLLETRGFEPAIHFDELSRDLSEPIPDLPVPDGLRLVPHDAVPPADALALRNEAFGDHRGSQPWTMEMWQTRGGESSLPDASFAIMDGDRPVAYAFCEAFPHDAADRGYTEGWVMGVGTAKSHRGRGLASIVICEAMKVFAAEGLDYATLGVDTENPTGAAGLYERLGFKRMRGHIEYTKIVDPEGDSAHDG
jgi:ribosomal protein S18 acetylase RimI-like enzyme